MTHVPQIKIPATYMRGGTSKGVFFRLQDLPARAQVPGDGDVDLSTVVVHQGG
ncbi:MAG: PrpF domain-containing protein, partial [Janthinobacterium sp.]